MRTKIIYEDGDILVCEKPAGLAVQSARVSEPDMVSELKKYLADGGGPPYLGVIHRLDQPVSGLLVFAKKPGGAAKLSAQAAGGQMQKEYRAAVALPEGNPAQIEPGAFWECRDYLVKGTDGNAHVVSAGEKGAKEARLSCRCLQADGDRALLEIRLETGRFHQIRAQLAHIGMPILGDNRYGTALSRALSAGYGIRRIQLQAVSLCFCHPGTGKQVSYELEEKLGLC